jgi:hypothetical protein
MRPNGDIVVDGAWLAHRAAMVAEGNRLLQKAQEKEVTSDSTPYVLTKRVMPDRASRLRLEQLQDSYRELLPDVVVARCPHTGVVVRWSIDVGDLDGWFWDADHQITRAPRLPPTWLATTGAVRLRGPVAWAPFMCNPGPAVPYVVPRVLDQDGVRAVIAQVPIGRHLGWAVSYFGPRLPGVAGIGRWGGDWAPALDGDRVEHSWSVVSDNDYELTSYLESGKLLWIAPDDETATLREDADACPYLGLDGSREGAYIKSGTARYFPEGRQIEEFTEFPCL